MHASGSAVVLAVSGGADSLALILAASEFRRRRPDATRFHVVTVDHRLRAEAAAEARHVEACARCFGLTVETRNWTDGPPASGNLAAAARNARYALLMDAAERCGASLILTAHHEDDQIETHLMASARGAGSFGLAGMRPLTELSPRIRLGRPFLGVPGDSLKSCVAAAGLEAVDDPTNRDEKSHRVRLRLALRDGEISGACSRRASKRHEAARTRGEVALADALSRLEASGAMRFEADGSARLARDGLRLVNGDQAFHLLQRLLTAVGGGEGAPGGEATMRLLDRLRDPPGAFVATLGGARVAADPLCAVSSSIVFSREFGREGPPSITIADTGRLRLIFDRRFDVTLPRISVPPGTELLPLGRLGRGGPLARTLPVLAAAGVVLAAPAVIAHRVAPDTPQLGLVCRVRWRAMADLVGADGISLAIAPAAHKAGFTL